jgi:hypothetical protein
MGDLSFPTLALAEKNQASAVSTTDKISPFNQKKCRRLTQIRRFSSPGDDYYL